MSACRFIFRLAAGMKHDADVALRDLREAKETLQRVLGGAA